MSDSRKISQSDLIRIRELAVRNVCRISKDSRLPLMTRALTESEVIALAYVDAILTVVNVTDVEIALEKPDSEVVE